MRKRFDMCLYADDLDKAITNNDRSNEESTYAVWVRDNIEADEEYKNLSAKQIAEKEIVGITVLEHPLYELMYFDETKMHLDIKNITLCTGSRCADGNVPLVSWDSDDHQVNVYWCIPNNSLSSIRACVVVS